MNIVIAEKDGLWAIGVNWFSFDEDVENKILYKSTIINKKMFKLRKYHKKLLGSKDDKIIFVSWRKGWYLLRIEKDV